MFGVRRIVIANYAVKRNMSSFPRACFLSKDDVVQRVKNVISGIKCAPSQISDNAHFIADLKFDSLRRNELNTALENEFCVRFASNNLLSVGSVADFIATHPKAR